MMTIVEITGPAEVTITRGPAHAGALPRISVLTFSEVAAVAGIVRDHLASITPAEIPLPEASTKPTPPPSYVTTTEGVPFYPKGSPPR